MDGTGGVYILACGSTCIVAGASYRYICNGGGQGWQQVLGLTTDILAAAKVLPTGCHRWMAVMASDAGWAGSMHIPARELAAGCNQWQEKGQDQGLQTVAVSPVVSVHSFCFRVSPWMHGSGGQLWALGWWYICTQLKGLILNTCMVVVVNEGSRLSFCTHSATNAWTGCHCTSSPRGKGGKYSGG